MSETATPAAVASAPVAVLSAADVAAASTLDDDVAALEHAVDGVMEAMEEHARRLAALPRSLRGPMIDALRWRLHEVGVEL